jgi:hypothetical protein
MVLDQEHLTTAGAASNDTLGYSNSFGPVTLSLATTKGGTRATSDGWFNDTV